MSIPSHAQQTATSIFQTHYGTPPGGQDAKAECEKWQRLCDELLAERARLRAESEKARLDNICKNFNPQLTREAVYAQLDRETTIQQIIGALEQEAEKPT